MKDNSFSQELNKAKNDISFVTAKSESIIHISNKEHSSFHSAPTILLRNSAGNNSISDIIDNNHNHSLDILSNNSLHSFLMHNSGTSKSSLNMYVNDINNISLSEDNHFNFENTSNILYPEENIPFFSSVQENNIKKDNNINISNMISKSSPLMNKNNCDKKDVINLGINKKGEKDIMKNGESTKEQKTIKNEKELRIILLTKEIKKLELKEQKIRTLKLKYMKEIAKIKKSDKEAIKKGENTEIKTKENINKNSSKKENKDSCDNIINDIYCDCDDETKNMPNTDRKKQNEGQ